MKGSSEAADFLTNTEAYFKDGHLVIRAELAGVDPKSVDVRRYEKERTAGLL